MRIFATILLIAALAVTAACPGAGAFEVWIINSSDGLVVTSVVVTGAGETPSSVELVNDAGVFADTTRVFDPINATNFLTELVTITVIYEPLTGGAPISVDIPIPEPLFPRLVIPISISGNTIEGAILKYVPLEG